MTTIPLHKHLPYLTFLVGGTPEDRRYLANWMANCDPLHVEAASIERPLREGMLGTFFHCDPTITMDDPTLKLPGVDGISAPAFCRGYGLWLEQRFGSDVLARIAHHYVAANSDYYQCFVFDDVERQDHIDYFIRESEAGSCLILSLSNHLVWKSSTPSGARFLLVPSGAQPERILSALGIHQEVDDLT